MGDLDGWLTGYGPRDRGYRSDYSEAAEQAVSKLSDAKIRRRKNVQANLSIVGASIGLGALGAKGVGVGARKLVKPAEKGAEIARKIDSHTTTGLVIGSGVGGVAGFNGAAINRAEAKKPNYPQHIRKDWSKFNLERKAGQKASKKVHPLVRQYGLKGELPGHLDHKQRLEVWEAREKRLNQKRNKWDKGAKASNALQIAGNAGTSAVGASLGSMALRDAYMREHPGKLEATAAKKGGIAAKAIKAKPSFKLLAIGGGAGLTAAAAREAHKVSEKKRDKYSSREGGTAAAAVTRLKKSAFGVDQ